MKNNKTAEMVAKTLRNSFLVELKGRTLKLGDAAKELGLDYFALHRLMHRRGFSFKQAVDYIIDNKLTT